MGLTRCDGCAQSCPALAAATPFILLMTPSIVVFTDFSAAAERARSYAAALAVCLKAQVHLLHVYPPAPEEARVGPGTHARDASENRRLLVQVAADMLGSTTATTVEADWDEAVSEIIRLHQPLLLVAGLTATDGPPNEWSSTRILPLAYQTGYPLLLVPEHLPNAALRPPHCLALAVRDKSFRLAPKATVVAGLLDALRMVPVPVTVFPPEEATSGEQGLRSAQECGLTATLYRSSLHRVIGNQPARGILQAVHELSADMLTLLDPGHGWVYNLFNDNTIEQVLRHARVPVLLLSTEVSILN